MNRLLRLTAFLMITYSLFASENNTVSLRDNQGRELVCTVVSKTDSAVTIINQNGKEFTIPVNKLDDASSALIANWRDPSLELFNFLNSAFIEIEGGKNSNPDTEKMIQEYLNLSKKYGIYTEFGPSGVPAARLSLASLIFALNDFTHDKLTGRLVYLYYAGSSGTSNLRETNSRNNNYTYAKVMNSTAQNWPKNLPYWAISDFRELQREMLKLSKDIADRNVSTNILDSKFFVSQGVRKYSKRIANILQPHLGELGIEQ